MQIFELVDFLDQIERVLDDGRQVLVGDLFLLVGEVYETFVNFLQLFFVQPEADRLAPGQQAVLARMFAEHDRTLGNADRLGRHDLVRERLLDHAILVHARFVRERILSDDRLVAGYHEAGHRAQQFRCLIDFLTVDARVERQLVLARAYRHHNLLEGRVAGALADTVDGALHLARAEPHGSQAVRDRHTEVVMTVRAQDDLFHLGRLFADHPEHCAYLGGDGIADGVGQIDDRSARFDDSPHDLRQIINVAPGRVLGRELDVLGETPRMLDGGDRVLQHLLARPPEFVFQMNVGRGDEEVNPRAGRALDGVPCGVDIRLVGPRQPRHNRILHR